MSSTWPQIDSFYTQLLDGVPQEPYWEATQGLVHLVGYIANGPLARRLFGFTSMHDLCIHQTERHPYADPHPFANLTPYLRISPTHSGLVEFRYMDHLMRERHWVRLESPDRTIARFDRFLDLQRWLIEERTAS